MIKLLLFLGGFILGVNVGSAIICIFIGANQKDNYIE